MSTGLVLPLSSRCWRSHAIVPGHVPRGDHGDGAVILYFSLRPGGNVRCGCADAVFCSRLHIESEGIVFPRGKVPKYPKMLPESKMRPIDDHIHYDLSVVRFSSPPKMPKMVTKSWQWQPILYNEPNFGALLPLPPPSCPPCGLSGSMMDTPSCNLALHVGFTAV